MQKRTVLYLKGRKDGRAQVVEHLPQNSDNRCLQTDIDHFVMRLWPSNGSSPVLQVVRKDRIKHYEVNEYGAINFS